MTVIEKIPGTFATVRPTLDDPELLHVLQLEQMLSRVTRPAGYKVFPTPQEVADFIRRATIAVHATTTPAWGEIVQEKASYALVWAFIQSNPWLVDFYRYYTRFNPDPNLWKEVNYGNS